MEAESASPFPDVKRRNVDPKKLSSFSTESEFTALGVDLLGEVASYVCIASCIMGAESTWGKEQAVVGGNTVRLFKLLSLFLEQTCEKKRELTDIIARLIFETAVTVRYLVANFSEALIESYIRHSLRHERKLFDLINRNVEDRNGVAIPIEDRMLKSLARASRQSGIELASVNLKDKGPWGGKNLFEKAGAVGWEQAYLAVFSGMSHNVHGSWQDLLSHHLESCPDDRFTPELEWTTPRPQALFALGLIGLEVVIDVAGFLGGDEADANLRPLLDDLEDRIFQVNSAHESYLTGKTWPAI